MNLSSEMLKLDNQLCFPVYVASRKITSLYLPYLKQLSLTYTQYITLLVLWEQKSITVKDLGSKLYLDSGTLTPLLKKLEQMHLIVKTRASNDERSVIVSLTKQGEEMYDKVLDLPEKIFCDSKLSMEEAVWLREHLKSFINTF
ncbi:MAG: MarR family transcriptional regulator [Vallitaleaceae bacterium]|nr:MarR family transcriptional regulator [Vallitaleaceae bacterium]